MTAAHTWEAELRDRGEEVRSGPTYDCPGCDAPTHAFAIVLVDGDWRCSSCRVPELVDERPLPSWADVRGQRAVFLQQTDWTQLPDVPDATRASWAPLRQRARDLTDAASVDAALELLALLLQDASAL